jgi:nitroreductase
MCQDDKNVYDLAVERRTIRKFLPKAVPAGLLTRLVEAARLAPSAANVQPLEFVVVDAPAKRAEIFPCLKWAAYIAPAGDPKAGEEPAAYVVTLVNSKLREKMYEYDVGAAMENMVLAGLVEGVGSC